VKKLVIATAVVVVVFLLGFFAASKNIYDIQATFDLQGHPTLKGISTASSNEVVIISDFKCPNCKRFDEEVLPQLFPLVRRGLVNISFIDKPVLARRINLPQDDSLLASVSDQCVFENVGINSYMKFRQRLYSSQGPETSIWVTKTLLDKIFEELDFQFKPEDCERRTSIEQMFESNIRLIDAQGIVGTPAVFVNGQRVHNDYKAIERALQ